MTLLTLVHRHTIILYAFVISSFLATSANATSVFINEFHYDNDGSDINEGIEIAGPSGTDLMDWSLVLYNSTNGSPYNTIDLNGIISDQSNSFGTIFFAVSSMQNGPSDGIALVDSTNFVRQFISYEGILTASSGPASGQSSEDIGIAELTTTALGLSVQLVGSGQIYTDFTWQAGPQSYNTINAGQTFTTSPVPLPAALPLFSGALLTLLIGRRRSRQRVDSKQAVGQDVV